ncbi:MAG: dUTP diphosphatase [Tepidanaerobacteraceae bacterium]|nr:dUTP diphosphatase [Tepidanaerobacteraceae bacterium]
MDEVKVMITKVKGAEDIPLPTYMTPQAAGMDLAANIFEEVFIEPGEYKIIPCGIKIELPLGYEAQVRPRSGLAAKYGVTLLNSPGTIDSDYRGEIKVILINLGKQRFSLKRGDRIAQLVISSVSKAFLVEKDELAKTHRGDGGFGHTGR